MAFMSVLLMGLAFNVICWILLGLLAFAIVCLILCFLLRLSYHKNGQQAWKKLLSILCGIAAAFALLSILGILAFLL